MTAFNQKLFREVQMLHGAVFSKKAPLATGGKVYLSYLYYNIFSSDLVIRA